MFFLDHIWIIPLLPLLGAAVMFCFGRGSRPRPAFAGTHDAHDVHDAAGLQAASGLQYVEASPNVTAFDPHAAHGPEDDQAPTAGHEPHAAEPYANPEAPHVFVNAICVGLIVIAFAWACMAVWQYTSFAHGAGKPFEKVLYTWLGTDNDGVGSEMYLSDRQGLPRIWLRVDADGNPSMEMRDTEGNVTWRAR